MLIQGPPSLHAALTEASARSSNYEWMEAAEVYKRALKDLERLTPVESAQVIELLSDSYFKAAFQSPTHDEFKRRMRWAEESYDNASKLYDSGSEAGKAKRAKARSIFSTHWLSEGPDEKEATVKRSISLAEDAAQIFDPTLDKKSLASVHVDLLDYLYEAHYYASNSTILKERFEKGIEIGEKAISEFETLGEDEGLLCSLNLTLRFLTTIAFLAVDAGRFQELGKKAQRFSSQVLDLSARINRPRAVALAIEATGLAAHFSGDRAKALDMFEAGLKASESVKDSYSTARLYVGGTINAFWFGTHNEDSNKMRELLEKAATFASNAIECLNVPHHVPLLGDSHEWQAECYTHLAYFGESEIEKKRDLLRKSIETARNGMAVSKSFDSWEPTHALSKALYFLAMITTDSNDRVKLLAEALPLIEKAAHIANLLLPDSWNLGVMYNYLALVRAELSTIQDNPETRIELLERATRDMQLCVSSCAKWATSWDTMNALANYEEWYGDILVQLHHLRPGPETSQRAISIYDEAISYLARAVQPVSTAKVRWKTAKLYDSVSNYKDASEAFQKAANDYRQGAQKIPSLSPLFQELGSYMDAWSLIEDARLCHSDEQFSLSSNNYAKAASTLQRTGRWRHLSRHYSACAVLEEGEALSRQEKLDKAIESFSAATIAFRETRTDLENNLKSNHELQENQELAEWVKITEGRESYSTGRLELEEAKFLDRKGEEEASLKKYRSAIGVFKKLLGKIANSQNPSELKTLMLFCEAWAKMKEAELTVSPNLYTKAAEAFQKAKEASTREKSQLLAQANASICQALEAGTRFRLTQDVTLYSDIKRQMQTAADCYRQAGFENAAEWTHATQRLFDALVYLADAEVERDSKKKTELYHLAEKHLELAAKLYGEAGYPRKREEALKQVERIREEKEILLTPVEALAENPADSRTSVAPATLARDQALGLERFESASVVGNMRLPQKELGVGSDLTLDLEMANVGKTTATLIKLENISLEGLELDREKIPYRVEDSFIDMKGKRLDYLKTHEMRIPMKAVRKGAFELRPRVLFVDEKGNYRSFEFEPAAVTVKELGISGWLKGPK